MLPFEPFDTHPFSGLEVWFVDLECVRDVLEGSERTLPRLSQGQINRFDAMKDQNRARVNRCAHIALRLLVERAFGRHWRGVDYATAPGGKPLLDTRHAASMAGGGAVSASLCQPDDFSLSHAGSYAVIGLARGGRIGVDLEVRDRLRMSEARLNRVLAAGDALSGAAFGSTVNGLIEDAVDPTAGALQAWVRLEAFAKLDGRGIGELLTRLGVVGGEARNKDGEPIAAGEIMMQLLGPAPSLSVVDLNAGRDRYAAAVYDLSGSGGSRGPRLFEFPDNEQGVAALLDNG